jgi:hypothetical protein
MRTLVSRCLRASLWRTCAVRIWMTVLTISVTSSLFAGCATTKAAAVDAGPPLAVPEAPQRVIVPAEDEPLASTATGLDRPLASVPQVQPPATAQPRSKSVPRAENDNRNEAASATAAATTASGNVPEPARDPRPLSPAETSIQLRVNAYLAKAANDLKCVDVAKLSNDRKTIYNESKRHADAAKERMAERNFVFAESAAEKAAAFAANLATSCASR